MSRAAAALEVRELTKVYSSPRVVANDSISFEVRAGEAFGLLGPNGAGKSTLVKQVVGLLRPTSGEIRLQGLPAEQASRAARVAYLPQQALALGELKVAEAIRWTGMLRGLSAGDASMQAEELIEELALDGLEDRQLRKLSGGQRRLVHIGMSLVAALPVLILDEPTTDIDPALRRRVWRLIDARARGGTAVVLVTHDVAEAEHALDRVAILDRGRVVTAGTPAELKASLRERVRLEVVLREGARVDVPALSGDLGGRVRVSGRHLTTWIPSDEAVRRLEKVMSSVAAADLEDVRLVTPSLEDVYLGSVGEPFADPVVGR